MYWMKCSSLVLILALGLSARAERHFIFVDGSYDPGDEHSEMDHLIDTRLQEASNQLKRIDPEGRHLNVDSKQALLSALRGIQCACGDEINLFFMGHGGNKKFIFSKASGRARTITAKDLKTALGSSVSDCCCKINLVIFSCHSGSMIEPLFEEEHVKSVYTSSKDNELTYTNAFYDGNQSFTDGGDWFSGFNEFLRGTRNAMGTSEVISEASANAKEKMPINFFNMEHPQGWVRDTLSVLAHVEGRPRGRGDRRYVEVTIYEPEHLRGQKRRIYINSQGLPDNINRCMWIEAPAYFNAPAENVRFTDSVRLGEKPQVKILAHVKNRYTTSLEVHTLRPNWLFCDLQYLRHDKDIEKDSKVVSCRWIEQEVTIHDPFQTDSIYNDIEVATPTFKVQYHVEKVNPRTGVIEGKILSPYWLNYPKFVVSQRERSRLRNLKGCTNIWVDIFIPAEGLPVGSGLRVVHSDDIRQWDRDIAINRIRSLEQKEITGVIIPKVTTTNVGHNTQDYQIQVWITKLPDDKVPQQYPEMDARISSGPDYFRDSAINYGGRSGCDCINCPKLYTDQQNLQQVASAESRESEFRPFQANAGWYKICAIAIAEGDEVEWNDTATIVIRIADRVPATILENFELNATGTGKTTGHVVSLTVTNRGESPEFTTLGPYIIPVSEEFQGYVIPFKYQISLGPGETTDVELDGYCIKIGKPPIPLGQSTVPVSTWITPESMGALPDPSDPASVQGPYTPLIPDNSGEFSATYPGTEVPFPFTIDLDEHTDHAAPLIFYVAESLLETLGKRWEEGPIETPVSGNTDKLNETLIQHDLWILTSTLDPDDGKPYGESDFHQKIIEQMEQNTSELFTQLPHAVQAGVETGIHDLWNEITLTGEKAKILKRKDG